MATCKTNNDDESFERVKFQGVPREAGTSSKFLS